MLGHVPRELLYLIKLYGDIDKVLDHIKISKDYFMALIHLYRILGLLRVDDKRCKLLFPLITKDEYDSILKRVEGVIDLQLNYIKRHIPEIMNKYAKSSLREQGFEWDDVDFLLIAGLLLDLISMKSFREMCAGIPSLRTSSSNWYLWAIEGGLDVDYEYWTYVYEGIIGGSLLLTLKKAPYSPIYLRDFELQVIKLMTLSEKSCAELAYELNIPEEAVKTLLDKWIKLGLVKNIGSSDRYKICFPFLLKDDYNVLFRSLMRLGKELCEAVFRRKIIDLLRHKYRSDLKSVDDVAYLLLVFYIIKCHVVSRLISEGLINRPPDVPKLPWGLCGWCII
ncbi:MAG: hypothetical protein DRJ66_02880 [Thermoprotei archaeon]|nr:MAG: hypothetical protein DRJ66_02880 [Thermoprotei archaeon]